MVNIQKIGKQSQASARIAFYLIKINARKYELWEEFERLQLYRYVDLQKYFSNDFMINRMTKQADKIAFKLWIKTRQAEDKRTLYINKNSVKCK